MKNKREIKFRFFNKTSPRMVLCEYSYSKQGFYWNGGISEGDDLSEPMQFIGIKDKDGVEIYEGDIIYDVASAGEPFIMKWNTDSLEPFGRYYEDTSDWKILGNIYQNSDLSPNESTSQ